VECNRRANLPKGQLDYAARRLGTEYRRPAEVLHPGNDGLTIKSQMFRCTKESARFRGALYLSPDLLKIRLEFEIGWKICLDFETTV